MNSESKKNADAKSVSTSNATPATDKACQVDSYLANQNLASGAPCHVPVPQESSTYETRSTINHQEST